MLDRTSLVIPPEFEEGTLAYDVARAAIDHLYPVTTIKTPGGPQQHDYTRHHAMRVNGQHCELHASTTRRCKLTKLPIGVHVFRIWEGTRPVFYIVPFTVLLRLADDKETLYLTLPGAKPLRWEQRILWPYRERWQIFDS